MNTSAFTQIRDHGLFPYSPIHQRRHYSWPGGAKLAVYIGFNVEHFSFGEGLGAKLGPTSPEPDVLNYSWREYGNRVGVWRCIELFDQLSLPTGAIINTALYDHCPAVVEALVKRGDEIIGHGHTNSIRQSDLNESSELELMRACKEKIIQSSNSNPKGWLSPWISESSNTSDLLVQAGYKYTLNWCHDDQPIRMQTKSGCLWSVPYPQELNDIPMLIARQLDAQAFTAMIIDNFEEMLVQSEKQPLVMGIALHPYLVGQPYRLRHLRKALNVLASNRDQKKIWFTTPGAICDYVDRLHD